MLAFSRNRVWPAGPACRTVACPSMRPASGAGDAAGSPRLTLRGDVLARNALHFHQVAAILPASGVVKHPVSFLQQWLPKPVPGALRALVSIDRRGGIGNGDPATKGGTPVAPLFLGSNGSSQDSRKSGHTGNIGTKAFFGKPDKNTEPGSLRRNIGGLHHEDG